MIEVRHNTAFQEQPLLATTPRPDVWWRRGLEYLQVWWPWMLGVIITAVVVCGGTWWGLSWWWGRVQDRPQTYQQCVASGGAVVTGETGQGCRASDGTFFAEPPADPLSAEPELTQRELEQQAAQARGEKIYFHDELGFKATAPVDWQGLVTAMAADQTTMGDFHPAVTLRSPGADQVQQIGVVVFSQPVATSGPQVGWGTVAAGGLAGIPNSPLITNVNPAVIQSSQISSGTLAGQPMVIVKRQFTSDLGGVVAGPGSCGGCWTKLYYFETPGQVWQIKATWRESDLNFEAQADSIVQSRQPL